MTFSSKSRITPKWFVTCFLCWIPTFNAIIEEWNIITDYKCKFNIFEEKKIGFYVSKFLINFEKMDAFILFSAYFF